MQLAVGICRRWSWVRSLRIWFLTVSRSWMLACGSVVTRGSLHELLLLLYVHLVPVVLLLLIDTVESHTLQENVHVGIRNRNSTIMLVIPNSLIVVVNLLNSICSNLPLVRFHIICISYYRVFLLVIWPNAFDLNRKIFLQIWSNHAQSTPQSDGLAKLLCIWQ